MSSASSRPAKTSTGDTPRRLEVLGMDMVRVRDGIAAQLGGATE